MTGVQVSIYLSACHDKVFVEDHAEQIAKIKEKIRLHRNGNYAASSDAFRQGLRIENQHAYFKIQKISMDCGHEKMLY